MDVHEKLDELTRLVEEARSMPMSASCIVNRSEVLAVLDDLRELLPEEFRHAELLLGDREAVVEEGRREANRIVEDARVEQEQLVAHTEVLQEATRRAQEVKGSAVEEALAMRQEVDDYVDAKLATFEVVLNKTLAAVERGREKLRGRTELEDLEGPLSPDGPLPE